jgi:hypothetical protein
VADLDDNSFRLSFATILDDSILRSARAGFGSDGKRKNGTQWSEKVEFQFALASSVQA